jgi:hypothetical protein
MANPYFAFDNKCDLQPIEKSCSPIFIVSSIWRSGSTLLQRTFCTDDSIIMWGEPYADCNLVSSMAQSAKALLQQNWPSADNYAWKCPWVFEAPHKHFIANLYPEPPFIRGAYRQFFDHLFLNGAKFKGYSRFGAKFVRLGLDETYFLQWIYPDAIFFFLVRNPWDCWRSYKGYRWRYRYPKAPVVKVEQFASLWQKQTADLLQYQGGNAGWLRYEDFLQDDFDWEKVKSFCELPNMTKEALGQKIVGVIHEPEPIEPRELEVINYICGDLARKLGYHGLKNTDISHKPF